MTDPEFSHAKGGTSRGNKGVDWSLHGHPIAVLVLDKKHSSFVEPLCTHYLSPNLCVQGLVHVCDLKRGPYVEACTSSALF